MDKSESEPESEMPLIAGKLHQETKKLLKEHVESLYIQVNGTSQEQLLTVYYTLWQQYSQGIDYLDMLYS
jgi:cullin 2